ncbi:MAG: hypothetical protein IPM07_31005 [Anaerolineales bacterium]|nr:hypothetical protein [Anaerolineales bacterium]
MPEYLKQALIAEWQQRGMHLYAKGTAASGAAIPTSATAGIAPTPPTSSRSGSRAMLVTA